MNSEICEKCSKKQDPTSWDTEDRVIHSSRKCATCAGGDRNSMDTEDRGGLSGNFAAKQITMDGRDVKMDPNTVFLEKNQTYAHVIKRMSTKASRENETSSTKHGSDERRVSETLDGTTCSLRQQTLIRIPEEDDEFNPGTRLDTSYDHLGSGDHGLETPTNTLGNFPRSNFKPAAPKPHTRSPTRSPTRKPTGAP